MYSTFLLFLFGHSSHKDCQLPVFYMKDKKKIFIRNIHQRVRAETTTFSVNAAENYVTLNWLQTILQIFKVFFFNCRSESYEEPGLNPRTIQSDESKSGEDWKWRRERESLEATRVRPLWSKLGTTMDYRRQTGVARPMDGGDPRTPMAWQHRDMTFAYEGYTSREGSRPPPSPSRRNSR